MISKFLLKFVKIIRPFLIEKNRAMSSHCDQSLNESMNLAREAFFQGIQSVKPEVLMPKWFKRENSNLVIGDKKYALRNTYLVGFGKAVAGMVPAVTKELRTSDKNYLKKGILSVPYGFASDFSNTKLLKQIQGDPIEVYEGAKFNLPDQDSYKAAVEIVNLVKCTTMDDLLIVLISGGGSALLPFPVSPLNLDEKTSIIQRLSKAGATISEINTVRKAISATKGGKLAQMTQANIITFVLSDIVGSRLDMIASGPTIKNEDPFSDPNDILRKYKIPICDNLKIALQNRSIDQNLDFSHVNNHLIGDNKIALNAVQTYLKEFWKCDPIIISDSIEGDVNVMGKTLALLAIGVLNYLNHQKSIEDFRIEKYISTQKLLEIEYKIRNGDSQICLLYGGETTVQVVGNHGLGGRNQEMVLAASCQLEEISQSEKPSGNIIFISGGTDGIDGPTDAAGAMTWYSCKDGHLSMQIQEAQSQGLNAQQYLMNNDSYNYFRQLNHGEYHLKTGHTGTNVMDIQILLISIQ